MSDKDISVQIISTLMYKSSGSLIKIYTGLLGSQKFLNYEKKGLQSQLVM